MAAIDTSRPLRTRSGARVSILCSNARGDMPIVGMVHSEKEDEVYTWKADGSYGSFQTHGLESGLDLVYVDEYKVYLPVFEDGTVGGMPTDLGDAGAAQVNSRLHHVNPHARFILELVYDGRRLESVGIIRRGEVTP